MSLHGVGDEFIKWHDHRQIKEEAKGFGWVFKDEPEFRTVWVLFVRLHSAETPEFDHPAIPLRPEEVIPWPPTIQEVSIEGFCEGDDDEVYQTRSEAFLEGSVIPNWIKQDPRVIEAFANYIGWRTPRYDGAPSIKWM